MICTFFGHRDTQKEIEPTLRLTLIDLIENHNVNIFYVGNHGNFDCMVFRVLKELAKRYDIKFYVVLAYLPKKQDFNSEYDIEHTIFPEGIENVPKRFAIIYRNKWMIGKSDYVVTYVTENIDSGATKFKKMAEKCGKIVINIFKITYCNLLNLL